MRAGRVRMLRRQLRPLCMTRHDPIAGLNSTLPEPTLTSPTRLRDLAGHILVLKQLVRGAEAASTEGAARAQRSAEWAAGAPRRPCPLGRSRLGLCRRVTRLCAFQRDLLSKCWHGSWRVESQEEAEQRCFLGVDEW